MPLCNGAMGSLKAYYLGSSCEAYEDRDAYAAFGFKFDVLDSIFVRDKSASARVTAGWKVMGFREFQVSCHSVDITRATSRSDMHVVTRKVVKDPEALYASLDMFYLQTVLLHTFRIALIMLDGVDVEAAWSDLNKNLKFVSARGASFDDMLQMEMLNEQIHF